ncbi:hypothetical protein HDU96_000282, partial [Phlyctochytrium bullatum]
ELLAELKNLEAHDLSDAGRSLNAVFDYLNAYRFSSGLEAIGNGRYIGSNEATIIMWFTDGTQFLALDRNLPVVSNRLNIPGLRSPGSQTYIEPFRWDQKLITFILVPDGAPYNNEVVSMSNAMNGDAFRIGSAKTLQQTIENCMGAVKPPHPHVLPSLAIAVTVRLTVWMEEVDESGNTRKAPIKTDLYPLKDDGRTFPIPEAFWVDSKLAHPPPKHAHPIICYQPSDTVYNIPHGLPFDRKARNVLASSYCLPLFPPPTPIIDISGQLYVKNSGREPGLGSPFGFLKVSSASRGGVNMYILPYNFPRIFKLLEQMNRNPSLKNNIPSNWRKAFTAYFESIPVYYHQPLKTFMDKMGLAGAILPPMIANTSGYPISALESRLKEQAKADFEKNYPVSRSKVQSVVKAQASATPASEAAAKPALAAGANVASVPLCENAFDVPRTRLLGELSLLKTTFEVLMEPQPKKRSQEDEDRLHSVPISEMGNYQNHPKFQKTQPLRDPFETDDEMNSRLSRDPFGNPWVVKSKGAISSDEASNEASVLGGGLTERSNMKRKRGTRRLSRSPMSPTLGPSSPAASESSVTSTASSLMSLIPNMASGRTYTFALDNSMTMEDWTSGKVSLSTAVELYKTSVEEQRMRKDEPTPVNPPVAEMAEDTATVPATPASKVGAEAVESDGDADPFSNEPLPMLLEHYLDDPDSFKRRNSEVDSATTPLPDRTRKRSNSPPAEIADFLASPQEALHSIPVQPSVFRGIPLQGRRPEFVVDLGLLAGVGRPQGAPPLQQAPPSFPGLPQETARLPPSAVPLETGQIFGSFPPHIPPPPPPHVPPPPPPSAAEPAAVGRRRDPRLLNNKRPEPSEMPAPARPGAVFSELEPPLKKLREDSGTSHASVNGGGDNRYELPTTAGDGPGMHKTTRPSSGDRAGVPGRDPFPGVGPAAVPNATSSGGWERTAARMNTSIVKAGTYTMVEVEGEQKGEKGGGMVIPGTLVGMTRRIIGATAFRLVLAEAMGGEEGGEEVDAELRRMGGEVARGEAVVRVAREEDFVDAAGLGEARARRCLSQCATGIV